MDSNLLAALISASITIVTITLAYFQWRRDVQIKLEHIRDEVTTELIKQRVGPYTDFFSKLEPMSTVHEKEIKETVSLALEFAKSFQEAIYGPVGLLASHDTRHVIVYARWGCNAYAEGKIDYDELRKCIWAVHLAIRSDLGIPQANWPSEIERLREQIMAENYQRIAERVEGAKHIKFDKDSAR